MLRFRRMTTLQKFAPVHANVHKHFNLERHLVDRTTYSFAVQSPWLSGKASWRETIALKDRGASVRDEVALD
jgi:hypothetical protein